MAAAPGVRTMSPMTLTRIFAIVLVLDAVGLIVTLATGAEGLGHALVIGTAINAPFTFVAVQALTRLRRAAPPRRCRGAAPAVRHQRRLRRRGQLVRRRPLGRRGRSSSASSSPRSRSASPPRERSCDRARGRRRRLASGRAAPRLAPPVRRGLAAPDRRGRRGSARRRLARAGAGRADCPAAARVALSSERSRSAAHPVAAALVGISWWSPPDGYLVVGFVAVFLLFYALAVQVDDLRVVLAVPVLAYAATVVALTRNDEDIGEWLATAFAVVVPIAVGRLVRARARARAADRRRRGARADRPRAARRRRPRRQRDRRAGRCRRGRARRATRRGPRRRCARSEAPAAEALAEMRRLLGVLRDGRRRRRARAAARARRSSTALVEHARGGRAAGRAARRRRRRARCPPALDLAAYRIVQEALTNVRKHAARRARERARCATAPTRSSSRSRDDGPGRANGADRRRARAGRHARARRALRRRACAPAPRRAAASRSRGRARRLP